jgi:secreted trypsin-like serine protease
MLKFGILLVAIAAVAGLGKLLFLKNNSDLLQIIKNSSLTELKRESKILSGAAPDYGVNSPTLYVVLLQFDTNSKLKCTGTLIRSDLVITAATCVKDTQTGIAFSLGNMQYVSYSRYLLHPRYLSSGQQNQFNIAVVKLDSPFVFKKPPVLPTALPSDNLNYFENQVGTIYGPGANSIVDGHTAYYNTTLLQLKSSSINILTRSLCSQSVSVDANINTLCGQLPGSATCTSDQGAPIFLQQNNSWMIVGVHTPSADIVDGSNCVYGSYAVFARVSDSLDFILTAMSAL